MAISRRDFFRYLIKGTIGLPALIGAYGYFWEPYDYEVTSTEIPLPGLPPSFDGFRITHISDVHHSRIVSLDEIKRMVDLAKTTKPDMYALTGDYTTSYAKFIEPCAQVLGELTAPFGSWAVLGNNDHVSNAGMTLKALERYGVKVLRNANTQIMKGAESLQLAGIDDFSWGMANWQAAYKGLDFAKPSILLSHQPSVFDMSVTERVSLILSGHLHGGQIRFPLLGPPARFYYQEERYWGGLFDRGSSKLFVTRGTGTIGIPFRIGARPEISVLTLRAR